MLRSKSSSGNQGNKKMEKVKRNIGEMQEWCDVILLASLQKLEFKC
jgi:hypothetical protein